MIRRIFFALLPGLAVTFCCSSAVRGGETFSEGFEAQSAPNWQTYGMDSAQISYTVDAGLAHGATTMLKMQKPADYEWAFLWQHLNGRATWGSTITIQAWVRNDGSMDCNAFVAISIKDKDSSQYRDGANTSLIPKVSWQPVTVTFRIPPSTEMPDLDNANIEVSFGLKGLGCTGPVLFDDVSVEVKD